MPTNSPIKATKIVRKDLWQFVKFLQQDDESLATDEQQLVALVAVSCHPLTAEIGKHILEFGNSFGKVCSKIFYN